MIYKPFQDIQLSALGMGNMRLPSTDPANPNAPIDWEKAHEILDYAMKSGINYYDTAYVYNNGESEKCVGAGMKKYPRNSFYLATKFFIMANPDYEAVFEEQLSRLQTDYIDFYLIHCLNDKNIETYLNSGAIAYFQKQKELGRIRYLGFSSHASVETLTRFADCHLWDFAQLQINYFDWKYGTAAAEYQVLADRNIPIMVMEPVRGGRLAELTPEAEELLKKAHPDWSIASWALRFVQEKPGIQVILSGMSNMEQIRDNVETFSGDCTFTPEDGQLLSKARELFHTQLVIPCTECRYCCGDCPMEINIPAYLQVYNRFKVNGPMALGAAENVESQGKPEDCIGCGSCTGHCPQNIQVPEIMKELAQQLDKMLKKP